MEDIRNAIASEASKGLPADDVIERYYDLYNYPSGDKLYKLLKDDGYDYKKKDITTFLSKKAEVQQFKEKKKSKLKHGHIISHQPDQSWQLDIYYMQKYYKHNHNYKYILACIDIFTRKAYTVPMKKKDNESVFKATKELFKVADVTPFVITSDSDSTFNSHEMQKLFYENHIFHHTVPVGDHSSLGIIDRFARSLKTILHKRFVKEGSLNWVDYLPKIVENYNNSPHTSIDDIKPSQATKPENIARIIDINIDKSYAKSTYINEFKEGDKVRIMLNGYHKKTEGQYTDKVYIVKHSKGKTIELTNGQLKKYDMLLKVHPETPIETAKPKLIKKAKQEYKQELLLKKEDIKQENIRPQRERKPVDYKKLNKGG